MKCGNHPEREAVTACNACGKLICSDCQVQMKGTRYCRNCISEKAQGRRPIEHSAVLAGILSFLIGGLGQVYNGQYGKGVLIFLTSWLIVPWVVGIVDAYNVGRQISEGQMIKEVKNGCLIGSLIGMLGGLFIGMVLFVVAIAALSMSGEFMSCEGDKGMICETPTGGEQ